MRTSEVSLEEKQPLNGMVVGNFKEVIIQRIPTIKKSDGPSDFIYTSRQYCLGLGPTVAALSSGMTAGFSAVLLPQLQAEGTYLPITKEQGTWIASMAALPMMLGCLCSSYPMDKFGRKAAVIGSCAVFSVGWIILALSRSVISLYAGRFLTGLSVGLLSPMVQVYIAETSAPKHRGILLSGAPLAVAFGILLSHVLGTFFAWKIAAGVCSLPPILCILILLPLPESPSWLLLNSEPQKAESSYKFYHGTLTPEYHQMALKPVVTSPSFLTLVKTAIKASFLKPLAVLLVFFFVQQFSGVNAVAFYTVAILEQILPHIDQYISMISIDIVRVIVSVIGVLLLKKFGRKPLAVTSAIGSALSLICLAIYLGVPIINFLLPNWLPLLFLILFICFVSIGLVPLPWVLVGEVFNKELRGLGSGISSSFGFICYFVVVKAAPDLFEFFGQPITFGLFGVFCLIGGLVLWVFLPETKDKTLSEIEEFYEKRKQVEVKM